MNRHSIVRWVPLTLSLLWLAAPVNAGQIQDANVTVDTTARSASGAIGTARKDHGNIQDIGCNVYLLPNLAPPVPGQSDPFSSTLVLCQATANSGATAYCWGVSTASGDAMLEMVTDSSYLKFTWDDSSQCTSIEIKNYSYYPPRQP